jgi:hypothetical protein
VNESSERELGAIALTRRHRLYSSGQDSLHSIEDSSIPQRAARAGDWTAPGAQT